ncbi:putative ribonuclease H-like domain-containing protein [Tanacetum coccineum]
MAGSDDDIPPPPPPQTQTPTQQAPHTVSTIKLPILKKGEYDIWAMKMEHYLAHTDYPIWEVIQRGNGHVSVSTDTNGVIKVLPPKTAEEILARERERKARTTLLMALPEDHLAKFHKMTDAKEMWEAIKSRFGGNDESKKMQKYILKQQFEGFSVSNSEGLHKGYDRFQSLLSQLEIHGAGVSTEDANQKFLRSLPSAWSQVSLIMRTKPGVDSLSFDDLYNNLRVFESDVKGSTASSSSTQNVAFVSENTSSTNDVSTAYGVSNSSGHFAREYRFKGNQDSRRRDAWNTRNKDKDNGRRSSKQEESKALVTLDGEGIDWTSYSEDEQENYALMAYNNSGSDTKAITQALKKVEAQFIAHQQSQLWYEEKIRFMKIDLDDKTDMGVKDKAGLGYGDQMNKGVLSYKNEVFQSVFVSRMSDIEDSLVNDRYVEGMHAVPPLITGIYIPSGPDKEIDDSQFTYGPKQSKPSESDARSSDFNYFESNSNEETLESMPELVVNEPKVETPSFAFINTIKHVKTPRQTVKEQNTCSKSTKPDKKDCSGLMYKELGLGYGFTKKACFVCGSFSHLIRDCDFHEKRMAKQVELNKRMCKGTSQRENRPVWNNVQRVNHQNQFVPTAVLTRTGRIQVNTARTSDTNTVNIARHNFNSQAVPTNAAKKVYTVKPIINNDYPQRALQNKGIVDSGCSRHMTGNKAYLAEYQDYNGGPVTFIGSKGYITGKGKIKTRKLDFEDVCFVKELQHFNLFSVSQMCDNKNKVLFTDTECLVLSPDFKLPDENQVLLRVPRQNNMYSFNLENIVPSGGLASLIAKATIDESNKWHRRSKGIKREYSNARTPQQNGVAERKNRTLIKATRTMLADSFLPNTFWAEAVSTACYVLNREILKWKLNLLKDYFVTPIWSSYTSTMQELSKQNEGFAQNTEDLLLQAGAARVSSTNTVNTASTPVSTASPSGGLSFTHLTNTNQDDLEIPNLEDSYDNPNDGIFTNASYDDEGVVADFTNLETIVNVSHIPTSRINSIHPSNQILGDPKSAVQIWSKVKKSSGAYAFVSYIQKQRRNNHKDFQHCLFACFLSQIEPKKISEALEDIRGGELVMLMSGRAAVTTIYQKGFGFL